MLTVLSMFSPCTQWVFGPLSPVTTALLATPIRLRLFDGSSSSDIVSSTTLSCTFPDGSVHSIEFFVTKLDSSVSAVLGYSWLTRTNPCIDWASSQLAFTAPVIPASPPPTSSPPEFPDPVLTPPKELITPQEPSTPSTSSTLSLASMPSSLASTPASSLPPSPSSPSSSLPVSEKPVHVALVGAAAFELATRNALTPPTIIRFRSQSDSEPSPTAAHAAFPDDDEPSDLTKLPPEYHEFADVFSDTGGRPLFTQGVN